MTRLRLAVLGFIVWMSFIYNIERVDEPINIASFVYVLLGLSAFVIVGWRRLRQAGPRWLLALTLAAYAPLKFWLGRWTGDAGVDLPLAVTEVTALFLTALVARQIGLAIDEFESAVAHLTVQAIGIGLPTFQQKQDEMYTEVCRARRFKRPLVMMILKADRATLRARVHRVVEEVQRITRERYALTKVARLLNSEMAYPALLAQDYDHFFLLMPELTREQAQARAEALIGMIRNRLSIEVRAGLASFPDQALTFEGLVEMARDGLAAAEAGPAGLPAPAALRVEGAEA